MTDSARLSRIKKWIEAPYSSNDDAGWLNYIIRQTNRRALEAIAIARHFESTDRVKKGVIEDQMLVIRDLQQRAERAEALTNASTNVAHLRKLIQERDCAQECKVVLTKERDAAIADRNHYLALYTVADDEAKTARAEADALRGAITQEIGWLEALRDGIMKAIDRRMPTSVEDSQFDKKGGDRDSIIQAAEKVRDVILGMTNRVADLKAALAGAPPGQAPCPKCGFALEEHDDACPPKAALAGADGCSKAGGRSAQPAGVTGSGTEPAPAKPAQGGDLLPCGCHPGLIARYGHRIVGCTKPAAEAPGAKCAGVWVQCGPMNSLDPEETNGVYTLYAHCPSCPTNQGARR